MDLLFHTALTLGLLLSVSLSDCVCLTVCTTCGCVVSVWRGDRVFLACVRCVACNVSAWRVCVVWRVCVCVVCLCSPRVQTEISHGPRRKKTCLILIFTLKTNIFITLEMKYFLSEDFRHCCHGMLVFRCFVAHTKKCEGPSRKKIRAANACKP